MKRASSFLLGYNPQEDRFVYDSGCNGGQGHQESGHGHTGTVHGISTMTQHKSIGMFRVSGHEHSHGQPGDSTGKYQCPMNCEGDKTYDKPGRCPECNMKLVEV